ncbi:MAG: hypothetical protein SF339_15385 [Blastocatellia bacterium]|nr:hypothetical protein [Blastocatellia bacterium]
MMIAQIARLHRKTMCNGMSLGEALRRIVVPGASRNIRIAPKKGNNLLIGREQARAAFNARDVCGPRTQCKKQRP